MDIPLFIVFFALFLAGAVLVTYLLLIVGIRAEDRRMNITAPPRTLIEALTRRLLGVRVRHDSDTDTHPHDARR
ncbi:hypothetical protein ABT352_23490 [Streptosporangium sp. NPDC000563]|uniref:hypothetical protein n=1 Tax=Streptosporangium sp. NPDC000563 TaxID=3154366 RepID=UPI0033204B8B